MTNSLPLAGITVLDLSRLLPGPLATQHLADYGAEVIKIEEPKLGDYARRTDSAGKHSAIFNALNRNKRSVALDLKSEADRALFLTLCETANLVVEGFRPGVMDRLGLGYDALAARNPAIVMCSISGYGQTGPNRLQAGHDINYLAASGVSDQTGAAGGPPALSNFQIADLAGGTLAAGMGMMIALYDAARTGRGRHVDVSMTDAAFTHTVMPVADTVQHGRPPERGRGRLSGAFPGYGYYETSDGRYMAVGALEAKFWKVLVNALSRPDLESCGLGTPEQQRHARSELEAIFRRRTQADWAAHFVNHDCCVNAVLTTEEALASAQVQARGLVLEEGKLAPPVRMSRFEPAITRPVPDLGADTAEVRQRARGETTR
ncbi:MAG: CaiB/BaiF CoA-transferase family protein [Roseovarius confluentis]